MKVTQCLVLVAIVTALVTGCRQGDPVVPTATPLAEFVEIKITSPFYSTDFTPETVEGAPGIEAGDTEFRWEPVQGAARYTVIIFDPTVEIAPDAPVPGDFYDQASVSGTSWSTNLVYRPGMDGDGRQLTVEISAYDADGYVLGFSGRFAFFIIPT